MMALKIIEDKMLTKTTGWKEAAIP